MKTQLVYTLSGVITPYASGIATPSSEVITPQSPCLFTTCALKTRRKLNPQRKPKTISGMFGDSNDIQHAYVQSMNAKQFWIKYGSIWNINTFPYGYKCFLILLLQERFSGLKYRGPSLTSTKFKSCMVHVSTLHFRCLTFSIILFTTSGFFRICWPNSLLKLIPVQKEKMTCQLCKP